MKKRGIAVVFLLCFILLASLIIAEGEDCTEDSDCATDEFCEDEICVLNETTEVEVTVDDSEEFDDQIDKAYNCLINKVKDCPSSLSFEEKVFSLLAVGECYDEILDSSRNDECWPSSSCSLKNTAQTILALDNTGSSTEKAEDWLLSQKTTPTNVIWYLQIESNSATRCTISYSGSSHVVDLREDKRISSSAGGCLSLSEGGYWFRISPNCYETEFQISCSNNFFTSLLYKRQDSSTIYVSDTITSASAEGTTTEKINSFCFQQGGACNYEGSLWAALALKFKGHDVSSFIPYLVTMSEDNIRELPEAFLYYLTGYQDFRLKLLNKQIAGYWSVSGDKFYDTALAVYSLGYQEPVEKTNAKEWLLEVQDSDGCWKGNIRNTAFILHSIWPRSIYDIDDSEGLDCVDEGYYCMSSADCLSGTGELLSGYDCATPYRCCSQPKELKSCDDLGGEICNSNENCQGVNSRTPEASDTSFGQVCCVGGSCQIKEDETECERFGGSCKSICGSGEEENSDDCGDSLLVCCEDSDEEEDSSSLWLWIIVLGILILLVVLAIIFRDKLKVFWMRTKSKFGKGSSSGRPGPRGPPGFPPPSSSIPMRGPPRRIIPNMSPPRNQQRNSQKSPSDVDDVLKKLKDLGK